MATSKKTPAKKTATKSTKAEPKVVIHTVGETKEKPTLTKLILVAVTALAVGGAFGWYVVAPALVGDGNISNDLVILQDAQDAVVEEEAPIVFEAPAE